ncbi:hypothetical protein PR048_028137 [Dryococelus australis]|uniref:Uncharacterized protein n=1 Tax=Dryococelus australis TaxID=614101 RepID=A0ABQ9GIG6_9NEOP|nr:hypothetical protein PR048_028137 [Dryococelus australis]
MADFLRAPCTAWWCSQQYVFVQQCQPSDLETRRAQLTLDCISSFPSSATHMSHGASFEVLALYKVDVTRYLLPYLVLAQAPTSPGARAGTRAGMESATENRTGAITKPVTEAPGEICHDGCRTGRHNGSYGRPCISFYEIWYRGNRRVISGSRGVRCEFCKAVGVRGGWVGVCHLAFGWKMLESFQGRVQLPARSCGAPSKLPLTHAGVLIASRAGEGCSIPECTAITLCETSPRPLGSGELCVHRHQLEISIWPPREKVPPPSWFTSRGATVVERLACSPPTKAIRVQSPAGSLRVYASGNRAGRCRWSAGFLGDLPFPPPFLFRRCSIFTSINLIGSQDLDVKSRPNLFTHSLHQSRVEFRSRPLAAPHSNPCKGGLDKYALPLRASRTLTPSIWNDSPPLLPTPSPFKVITAPHLGETRSIPGGVAAGFSHEGFVPDFAAGRRVLSEISCFCVSFRRCSVLTSKYSHRLSRPRCSETPKSFHSIFQATLLKALFTKTYFSATQGREGNEVPRENPTIKGNFYHFSHVRKTWRSRRESNPVYLSNVAAMAERLDCSPPTKAYRSHFPARTLPDFRKWESCRMMPLIGGFFSGISRFPFNCIPALLHSHLISRSSALKTSLVRAAQISQLSYFIALKRKTGWKGIKLATQPSYIFTSPAHTPPPPDRPHLTVLFKRHTPSEGGVLGRARRASSGRGAEKVTLGKGVVETMQLVEGGGGGRCPRDGALSPEYDSPRNARRCVDLEVKDKKKLKEKEDKINKTAPPPPPSPRRKHTSLPAPQLRGASSVDYTAGSSVEPGRILGPRKKDSHICITRWRCGEGIGDDMLRPRLHLQAGPQQGARENGIRRVALACKYPGERGDTCSSRVELFARLLTESVANEKAEGNGRSPRKPADQRNRPAQFPLSKIPERPTRGLNLVRLGEGESILTAHLSDEIVGIVLNDAGGWRVLSRISRFPALSFAALLHDNLISPSSALKTSFLRSPKSHTSFDVGMYIIGLAVRGTGKMALCPTECAATANSSHSRSTRTFSLAAAEHIHTRPPYNCSHSCPLPGLLFDVLGDGPITTLRLRAYLSCRRTLTWNLLHAELRRGCRRPEGSSNSLQQACHSSSGRGGGENCGDASQNSQSEDVLGFAVKPRTSSDWLFWFSAPSGRRDRRTCRVRHNTGAGSGLTNRGAWVLKRGMGRVGGRRRPESCVRRRGLRPSDFLRKGLARESIPSRGQRQEALYWLQLGHSPGVISGNHGEPEIRTAGPGIEPGSFPRSVTTSGTCDLPESVRPIAVTCARVAMMLTAGWPICFLYNHPPPPPPIQPNPSSFVKLLSSRTSGCNRANEGRCLHFMNSEKIEALTSAFCRELDHPSRALRSQQTNFRSVPRQAGPLNELSALFPPKNNLAVFHLWRMIKYSSLMLYLKRSCSPPTKVNRVQSSARSQDSRKWESCRTTPMVGAFSRGSPVSPAPSFRLRFILNSITLIGSQYLAVKSRPNIFIHSLKRSCH